MAEAMKRKMKMESSILLSYPGLVRKRWEVRQEYRHASGAL